MVVASQIIKTSIKDAKKLLASRTLTATDLCRESLQAIKDNERLNVFTTVCSREALDSAKVSDDKIQTGSKHIRPLEGVPVSIKDNICTNGILTTCASKMLHNFVPPYDAQLVSKLKSAGAVIVGKTNMDEFAMGSSSTTSHYGPTANWMSFLNCSNQETTSKLSNENSDLWYMAGGSSTGSAVSVATGSSFASIGTDTGGSTRQPASLVGVVGYKPSYGLISRFGLIPLVHSLDVVSILARTVEDVRNVFNVVAGEDKNDLTSVDCKTYLKRKITEQCKSIRIGIPRVFIEKGEIDNSVSKVFDSVLQVLEHCSEPKFEIVPIELEHSRTASECYTILASSEIASNMSCYDGVKYGYSIPSSSLEHFNYQDFYKANRDIGFGDEVKKRIFLGNYFLLEQNRDKYLTQALKVRRLINDEFSRVFKQTKIDLIMTPSTPTTAITHKEWLQKQYTNKLFQEDYFLIPSNLANLPSISVPVSSSENKLPVGVQLIGDKYHDIDLLFMAGLFELEIFKSNMSIHFQWKASLDD